MDTEQSGQPFHLIPRFTTQTRRSFQNLPMAHGLRLSGMLLLSIMCLPMAQTPLPLRRSFLITT
jgi:hypothetical protein